MLSFIFHNCSATNLIIQNICSLQIDKSAIQQITKHTVVIATVATSTTTTTASSVDDGNNLETINLISPDNSPNSTPITNLTKSSNSEYLKWKKDQHKDIVILALEEYILSLLRTLNNTTIQINLLESIIRKKITIKEYLYGYSVCLREYLNQSPNLRTTKFALFFPIIYSPLRNELYWGESLPDQLDYQEDILKSPLIQSESLLHEVLSGAYPYNSPLKFRLNNFDMNKFRSIKSEPTLTPYNLKIKQENIKFETGEPVKRKRTSPNPSPQSSSSSSSNVCILLLSSLLIFTKILILICLG